MPSAITVAPTTWIFPISHSPPLTAVQPAVLAQPCGNRKSGWKSLVRFWQVLKVPPTSNLISREDFLPPPTVSTSDLRGCRPAVSDSIGSTLPSWPDRILCSSPRFLLLHLLLWRLPRLLTPETCGVGLRNFA